MPRYFCILSCTVAWAAIGFARAFTTPPLSKSVARTQSSAYAPLIGLQRTSVRSTTIPLQRKTFLRESESSVEESPSQDEPPALTSTCWNPILRKQMATLSSLGILETSYLTYDKLHSSDESLLTSICTTAGSSCSSILNGPYSTISVFGNDIPLSLLGVGAYITVFALSILPLLFPQIDKAGEINNRIGLLGITVLMGSFSVYLVSLILGVLHTSCLFCFISAGLSVTLAGMAWFGGALPSAEDVNEELSKETVVNLRKDGVFTGVTMFGVATVMALALFVGVDDSMSLDQSYSASSTNVNSGTLVTSTEPMDLSNNIPPPITTKSSQQALTLASDLSSLNSKMYGAFWCSHCYDQKQSLGYQAMQSIPYVECDREGYNNQRDLCRARDVPGYPTWEIGGELFPGERSLDELREIVDGVLSKKKGV